MARRSRATSQFRREVDNRFPTRPRTSDGWIGDAAHRNRVSDHNPNRAGVVQAEDVTLTDTQGDWLWKYLIESRDPRIKYVIYRRRIFSSYATSSRKAWTPGPYNGVNAHLNHLHLSVADLPYLYDDDSSWGILVDSDEEDDVYVVKFNERGPRVRRAQRVLQAAGKVAFEKDLLPRFGDDGHYGEETAAAVDEFAKRMRIDFPREGKTGLDVLVLDYCRHWLESGRE